MSILESIAGALVLIAVGVGFVLLTEWGRK
jgi:hypothetical protein